MIDTNQQFANIKSYCGDLEVIGNGISPAMKSQPLCLKVDNLEIEFEFLTDNSNTVKSETRVVGNKLLYILTNFNNQLGSGMIEPFEFGHIKGRKLYISFWIWVANIVEEKRLINWTILLGSEITKSDK